MTETRHPMMKDKKKKKAKREADSSEAEESAVIVGRYLDELTQSYMCNRISDDCYCSI